MSNTYWELLKRPEWQRKRLEVMQGAGWKCQMCSTETKTLHVHHRMYVKGRKPWEYQNTEFDVLCEGCHAEGHKLKDKVNWLLRQIPSRMLEEACGLLTGFYADELPSLEDSLDEGHEFYDAYSHEAGVLAKTAINHLPIEVIAHITVQLLGALAAGDEAVTLSLKSRYGRENG